ncbi:MAG: NAD(+) synthase, partial [Candidatus Thermoplasmatota archaeon]
MLELRFNSESKRIIEEFIISRVEKAKANGVVLGLSGGVDSSLVAKLCASALGNKNVLALIMPFSNDEDIKDAIEYAKKLGIRYKIISIDEILKACKNCLSKTNKKSIGNLKARIRMLLLYAYANSKNLIVVGTGNKTELLCGYFTK